MSTPPHRRHIFLSAWFTDMNNQTNVCLTLFTDAVLWCAEAERERERSVGKSAWMLIYLLYSGMALCVRAPPQSRVQRVLSVMWCGLAPEREAELRSDSFKHTHMSRRRGMKGWVDKERHKEETYNLFLFELKDAVNLIWQIYHIIYNQRLSETNQILYLINRFGDNWFSKDW